MRVAIYLRVSTTEQAEEGFSIAAQKERLKAYIMSQGWELASTYEDGGYSGGTTNRPSFNKLREDMRHNQFDLILVYKLDRLSRNMRDLSNLVHEMDEQGVFFKSATEPFDTTTPAGKLIFNMLGSVAEFERGMIAERVRMGMMQKAREGKGLLGFNHPFGYDYRDGKLILNQQEAGVVRSVYSSYISGSSLGEIAYDLNSRGFRTKNDRVWTKQTVLNIIGNPLYAGYHRWSSFYWKGQHDPIIEVTRWNKAQRVKSFRSRSPSGMLQVERLEDGEFGIAAAA